MLGGEEAIEALRQALRLSPENLPLRQHLAETLLSLGRYEEAEHEYRQALARVPEDQRLKLGLASAFYQQGKNTQALVLVEDTLSGSSVPPRAYLLHARLLLRTGEVAKAVHQYRKAVEFDPSLADPDLAERLGIKPADTSSTFGSDDFVVEGKVRAAWEAPVAPLESSVERPAISFRDVGGMEALKDEIRLKIIHPLTHPELYRAYGKAIGGGIPSTASR